MPPSSTVISPSQAFSGTIQPTRVAPLYQAALLVVALTMIMLPLVYVGLIVVMAKVLWWHLTHSLAIFEVVRGRAMIFALLIYLGPAIAGVIFILFLIKPLFSRPSKQGAPFKVFETEEPELHAFVRKICGLVGAPMPREIRLDSLVNASAGFRRGGLSFLGNDLVLTIGMPLAAGLTVRQLAGVLAHEFGHFAQGAGMRMSYIIRRVNLWFARVVYERDHWDDRLDEWAAQDDWRIQLVFNLAKGGVWVGRRFLWCLMQAGHAISCFMSRQMEFDADSYEAKVAGSEEFAITAGKICLLNAARNAAMQDAIRTFQHRELPEDLASLVVWRESTMPAEIRQEFEKHLAESKTKWFDTHPCDRERVKAAASIGAPGVVHLSEPASVIFRDFQALSREVTRHFYVSEQELNLDKVQFSSATEMIADTKAADEAGKHLEIFYRNTFHPARVKSFLEPPGGDWSESYQRMESGLAPYAQLMKTFNQHQVRAMNQSTGLDLLDAKFTLTKPGEFDFTSSEPRQCKAELAATRQALQDLSDAMTEFETTANQRLETALAWWETQPETDNAIRLKIERLKTAQRPLAEAMKEGPAIRSAAHSLQTIFANAASHTDGTSLERHARAVAERIEQALKRALGFVKDAAHPFLPDGRSIVSSLHLADKEPNAFARAQNAITIYSDGLQPLLMRIMGELAGWALEAERRIKEDAPAWEPLESDIPSPESSAAL